MMEMDALSAQKIYVAIGTDLHDGFTTLEWVLKRWNSRSASVVILYADNSISKDYVYTPIGKMLSSSVCEEKLQFLDKSEEAKTDKILAKYMAFCGKVKVEGIKIDRLCDEPLQQVLVELITSLRMTKLVMAFSFMRFSSWKSKSAISAAFHVNRQKPSFCNLSIICGGKQVFLREENNEGIVEDEQGFMIAKLREKIGFRGWLGKMFPENVNGKNHCDSPSSASSSSPNQWDKYTEEIEHYFNELLTSSTKEDPETADDTLLRDQRALNLPENMGAAEKIEALRIKIRDNQEAATADAERCTKAKWAIDLCTKRAEELQFLVEEEHAKRVGLQQDLEITKEEIYELHSEVEEKRNKLNSILELQRELSNKLQLSSLEKSRADVQLAKAVHSRAEMIQGIEELRRQRDVLQRRIEFCKEKDSIIMANRLGDFNFDYRKYTAEEIRAATDDFSKFLRLKSTGEWRNVYKGRINQTTVAIKLCDSADALSREAFQEKVKLLGHIRHPHILGMIGFCTELKCVVYEYMQNGCLRDTLFSNPLIHKGRKLTLSWHARIRIAAEVCTGLSFLHRAKPKPIVHGNLNPSKILLDKNNVANIYGFKQGWEQNESDIKSDIRAFGTLLLQLLTGRNWARVAEEAIPMDSTMLVGSLDKMAGEWPLDLAVELGGIAKCCLCSGENQEKEFCSKLLMRWIEKVRRKADELVTNGDLAVATKADENAEVLSHIPRVFFCPIYQDVMKNPHLAADGFSYEFEAIEEWLRTGHDTSPMTNLRLNHKLLTPNHTLRSLIQDWLNKSSVSYS